jgi:hypothetical protein
MPTDGSAVSTPPVSPPRQSPLPGARVALVLLLSINRVYRRHAGVIVTDLP